MRNLTRYFSFVLLVVLAPLFLGCATETKQTSQATPDLTVYGTVGWGNIRGDRAEQIQGAIESRLMQMLPNLQWSQSKSDPLDYAIDLTIYSARITDTPSSYEQRNCRRWSDGDPNKGGLSKLLSRNCLDWDVRQVPCVTRTYESDLQIRLRDPKTARILASDRKVDQSNERKCGQERPSSAALQFEVESNLALWAEKLLLNTMVQQSSTRINPSKPTEVSQANKADTTRIESSIAISQPSTPPIGVSKSLVAHALVIGNSSYGGSSKLANPINDARAMSNVLRGLGFTVTESLDTYRTRLVTTLSQFSKTAANADISLLFYAGHGVQISGTNYMLPVDLNLNDLSQVPLQGVSLNSVVEQYLPGKTKLVFLDACRDNPLMQTGSRSVSRGLAPINVSEGTLISYSTKDGQVAQDGDGKNSPFTTALLKYLNDPDDIAVILRKVREDVLKNTGGKQQPWEYGSLTGGALVLSAIKPNK